MLVQSFIKTWRKYLVFHFCFPHTHKKIGYYDRYILILLEGNDNYFRFWNASNFADKFNGFSFIHLLIFRFLSKDWWNAFQDIGQWRLPRQAQTRRWECLRSMIREWSWKIIKMYWHGNIKVIYIILGFWRAYVTVTSVSLVNPSIHQSKLVKVRNLLLNTLISRFYQTISVYAGIYRLLWFILCPCMSEMIYEISIGFLKYAVNILRTL